MNHLETVVAMPAGLSLPIYFANRQWAVTSYGIERLDYYYPIEAHRLGQRWPFGGLLDWPMHLCDKASSLCLDSFLEAFEIAVKRHAKRIDLPVTSDQVAASAEAARLQRRKVLRFEHEFDAHMKGRRPCPRKKWSRSV